MLFLANTAQGQFWVLYCTDEPEEYLRDNSISLIFRNAADSKFSRIGKRGLFWNIVSKDDSFLEALDQGYTSGSWRISMLFSNRMLIHNKFKYSDLINRYANHDFTPEKRMQNAKSGISENDVVKLAKEMKEKFKI